MVPSSQQRQIPSIPSRDTPSITPSKLVGGGAVEGCLGGKKQKRVAICINKSINDHTMAGNDKSGQWTTYGSG